MLRANVRTPSAIAATGCVNLARGPAFFLNAMNRRYFIGLHAGSSHFGVDAALVRTEGTGLHLALRMESFLHLPYSSELRDLLVRVLNAASPEMRHLATLHRVLGEHAALAVKQLLDQSRAHARRAGR